MEFKVVDSTETETGVYCSKRVPKSLWNQLDSIHFYIERRKATEWSESCRKEKNYNAHSTLTWETYLLDLSVC